MRVDIRGAIIPNDYKWFYDWLEEDSTCPKDVAKAITEALPGENLDVFINSPGGVIDVGSEIYTMLRSASAERDVKIYITGEACSAASVIAMAGYSEMAPTALMMVHCVSTYGGGNHSDFEHAAEMLRTADEALCTAYTAKAGMTKEEALAMMEHETWLTAEQAKEKGLVDAIMFEENDGAPLYNAIEFKLPSAERMEAVRAMMAKTTVETEAATEAGPDLTALTKAKMNMLKLSARRL